MKRQDFTIKLNWRELDINSPPGSSGIYAVVDECGGRWFYIGKADSIARRIANPYHPIQITRGLNLGLRYLFLRVSVNDTGWLERYLIRLHNPEWNGGTNWGAMSGQGARSVYPYCVVRSMNNMDVTREDEQAALALVGG